MKSRAKALLALLGTFGQMPDCPAEPVASILWGLYRDFLADLALFQKMRHSPPMCAKEILRGWLEGMHVDHTELC